MSTELDPRALDRLRKAGGRPLLEAMVGLFLRNTPDRLVLLRAGSQGGEWSSVERLAHSMKSSAGTLGLRDLGSRAEQVEDLAREGRGPELRPLLEGLDRACGEVLRDLPGLLRSLLAPEDPPAFVSEDPSFVPSPASPQETRLARHLHSREPNEPKGDRDE